MKPSHEFLERIDIFLQSIGLVGENGPLAVLREIQFGFVTTELCLAVPASEAAKLVESHTDLVSEFKEHDGNQFWTFHVKGKGMFIFEAFKTGKNYMMIFNSPKKI